MSNYFNEIKNEITPILPKASSVVFDGAEVSAKDAASQYEVTDLRLLVAAALTQWGETDASELDDGESFSDRLNALLVGVVDADKDGEISEEESDCIGVVFELAAEWMADLGVATKDIEAILNDDDEEAAENVVDLLKGELPDGEDAIQEAINEFAGLGSVMDGGVLDAAYKKKVAVRNGKKVIIKKRISGKVRLTSAQKMAIAKAQRKSHSGAARMKRAKSMLKRRKLGL